MNRIIDAIADILWPRATPFSREEAAANADRRTKASTTATEHIGALRTRPTPQGAGVNQHVLDAAGRVEVLLEQQRGHIQSVDARLLGVLGQTSVAAALIIAALASKDLRTVAPAGLRVGLALLLLYMILQLLCGLRAALDGLQRRSYSGRRVETEIPEPAQPDMDFAVQRLEDYTEILMEMQEHTNEKVTSMAVAHTAFRNFIWAAVVFSVALAAAALWGHTVSDVSGSVISISRHLR